MIFPNASILDRRSLAAEAHAVANDAALYGAAEGAGDEQEGAAPFAATGLPAVAEEGFALEVAVELVGELDAEVLEDVFFEVHSDGVRLRMGLELPPFRRLAVGVGVFFIVFFIFLVGMCCGSGKLSYLCGEKDSQCQSRRGY